MSYILSWEQQDWEGSKWGFLCTDWLVLQDDMICVERYTHITAQTNISFKLFLVTEKMPVTFSRDFHKLKSQNFGCINYVLIIKMNIICCIYCLNNILLEQMYLNHFLQQIQSSQWNVFKTCHKGFHM